MRAAMHRLTGEHASAGRGRVAHPEGSGDNAKLRVEFSDATRTLLARFVVSAD
jgi:hypothetical protein